MIATQASLPFAPRALAPILDFKAPAAAPGRIFAIGATHGTASLAFREQLALKAETEAGLAAELSRIPGLREFVLLGTCNRLEIYGVCARSAAIDSVEAALCSRCGIPSAEFARIRLRLEGGEAIRHLLEVAAGLDSQMLGETEIFGQMKRAYASAQARRSCGPVLNRAFQKVFQGAKHVRRSTAITVGQVSVANVAVDLASKIFGPLSGVRILVLGAGEIGQKTARAFHSRGADGLVVANRRQDRADALAAGLGGTCIDFAHREERLSEYDIVVSSTSAPDAILSAAAARAAMKLRPARPLLLIDLALPRDIEPGAAAIANVFLYNLDDLARIAEQNRTARAAEIAKCQALVTARAAAIWQLIETPLSGWRPALAS